MTVKNARKWLAQAIARHERHMAGTEPTDEASQMRMMQEMKAAAAELKTATGDSVRAYRIDYAPANIVLVDELEAPTPVRGTAVKDADGYLHVDAYIARDGLLRYSDGQASWMEYRPRAELVAAAATWAHRPVTDDHPERMVSPETWAEVARGVHVSTPVVEGPLKDGISYLRARLMITDAALIEKIEAGEARELSIGFMATILPAPGRVAADGTRCDAIQSGLEGNHTAVVVKGRAGPSCAILLDGAAIAVYDPRVSVPAGDSMPKSKTPPAPVAAKPEPKIVKSEGKDGAGMPTTLSKLVMPDGSEIEVPTALAAIVEEWVEMKKGAGKSEPAAGAPAPEVPAAEAAAAPASPASPAAAAANPDDDDEDDKMDKPMTKDQIADLVKRRGRLVRLATEAGLDADKIDAADDEALARSVVETVCPHLKGQAAKAKGDALDVLVEVAAATPRTDGVNPWEQARTIELSDSEQDEVAREAKLMIANGAR